MKGIDRFEGGIFQAAYNGVSVLKRSQIVRVPQRNPLLNNANQPNPSYLKQIFKTIT